MRFSRLAVFVGVSLALARVPQETTDKYQWLEDVHGERSLAWVRAHNERTDTVLKTDPRYGEFRKAALSVLQSPQRLPIPALNGDEVYNFWQDSEHVNGILRRTPIGSYLSANPSWQTVLDYDALSKAEGHKWVAHGRHCLYPGNELCLMELSAGGEDASTFREFNLKTQRFVENGFTLPRSKQFLAWIDRDTLLVSCEWGPGAMTKSGYPFVAKIWKRGTALTDAKEVYRGSEQDMRVAPIVLRDSEGHQINLILRLKDFFKREYRFLSSTGVQLISLPEKAWINGLVKGQVIVSLDEDWTPAGAAEKIPQGSVIALNVVELQRDPIHLRPRVIFTPSPVEFAQEVEVTKNRIVLTTLENVQGRAYVYSLGADGEWTRARLDLPDNMTVNIETANWADDRFFISTEGLITPPALLEGDAAANTLRSAKAQPAQFDASSLTVEQLYALSKDGVKVPYFIARPKGIKYDGNNPTLLSAYGGFQVSETPYYSPAVGKLWLEKGGVYVLANIRGGGEFGPAWHEAGLKTHRQRIYDDFAGVAQDLIARRITSPRCLGITGASNGGLLMGVEMTQHPDLWNAIGIAVPLLDMLGYEHIAAGASWVAEYGSVSVPEERAFLASISPYNQLKPDVSYPEPLIFTTTKDDRVGPQHARKFASKMEEFHEPFYYEEIIEGGHGAGADLKERSQTEALFYTYFARKLMGSSVN